jgi:hypothetical protein
MKEVGLEFHPKETKVSIVKMMTGEGIMQKSVLILWVIPFALAVQRIGGENTLLISLRQSVIRLQKQSGTNHVIGTGHYVATSNWKILPECSIRSFKVRLTIVDVTIS